MVCKQSENQSELVQWATLLHDIGKPKVHSINKKGHSCFYNHDAVSAFMALDVLENANFWKFSNLIDRHKLTIFKAISIHTQVFKQTPDKLGEMFANDVLTAETFYELGVADHSGRFTSTEGSVNEPVYTSRGYPSDKTKRLTLLCGLPASGKSSHVSISDYDFVVSRDGLIESSSLNGTYNEKWKNADQKEIDRLLQLQYVWAKQYNNVVIDMTHMNKKSRRKSLSHFGDEYYKCCIVYISPLSVLELRNMNRNGKAVPDEVYERMLKSFYPPLMDEFDEVIWKYDNTF